jgi:hypothetical protein
MKHAPNNLPKAFFFIFLGETLIFYFIFFWFNDGLEKKNSKIQKSKNSPDFLYMVQVGARNI